MSRLETIVVGCDPGLEGALSAIFLDGSIDVIDMPVNEEQGSTRLMRSVDGLKLGQWFDGLLAKGRVFVALERVHAMPKQTTTGAFTFGEGYGKIKCLLEYLKIPFEYAEPQKWKKEMLGIARATRQAKKGKKLPKRTEKQRMDAQRASKGAARLKAKQLFPQYSALFERVMDDGRAESVLIAEWQRRKLMGVPVPPGPSVQLGLELEVAPEVQSV